MDWILSDEQLTTQINPEMRKQAEAATRSTILATIPADTDARLGADIALLTVKRMLETIERKFIDKREERQEELRNAAKKIKMHRNRTVADYIHKHIILSKDMLTAGCEEITRDNERETIRYIVAGLKGKEVWTHFRRTWKRMPVSMHPGTIDDLERIMVDQARDMREEKET